MKHKHLTKRGYNVAKDKITKEQENEIIKDLTVSPISLEAFCKIPPKKYMIYYHSKLYYYLPKNYGIEKFGNFTKNCLPEGEDRNLEIKFKPLPFQDKSVKALDETFNRKHETNGGILSLPCGYGKCHGKDTKILMFDKTIKNVQDIKPGDMLCGDDDTKRDVYTTVVGYGEIYEIEPINNNNNIKYNSYTCNDDHILYLYNNNVINNNNIILMTVKDFFKIKNKNDYYGVSKFGDIFNIKIKFLKYDFFYGFVISDNSLYCLADGQITHNTYLSLYTACNLKKQTIIFVTKEFLRDQWIDAIKKFTNGTYGIIQQDKCDIKSDFVIALIHTISLQDFPENHFDSFGMLIIDECHHIASEMFVKSLMKIRPRFILGLSATPTRKDGLSHVFHKFIGDIIHKEKRTENNNVIIKTIILNSKLKEFEIIYKSSKVKDTINMTTALSECKERNILIIEFLNILYKQNRTILLLSGRRKHLYVLEELIKEAHKNGQFINDKGKVATYGFYFGRGSDNPEKHKERLRVTATCDIILGTSDIAEEGLDIPALNTLIFSTPPCTDVEQAVGRILRKKHSIYPLVVDIVDNTGNFKTHYGVRKKWYTSEEYEIHKKNILLTENYIPTKDLEQFLFVNKLDEELILLEKDINRLKKQITEIKEDNNFIVNVLCDNYQEELEKYETIKNNKIKILYEELKAKTKQKNILYKKSIM